MKKVVYVVDVGSPEGGLAWARLDDGPSAIPSGGPSTLDRAATLIADDLRAGAAVALGFEGPGFLPVARAIGSLNKARTGESRAGIARPWSYGAGAYAALMALPVSAWLLRQVRLELGDRPTPPLMFDPAVWTNTGGVLLWEAFVSGPGHASAPNQHGASEHIQDAATAAIAFLAWLATSPRPASAVTCDPRLTTLGASALWANWSADLTLLSAQPLVLWPNVLLGANVTLDAPVAPKPSEPNARREARARSPNSTPTRSYACPIPSCSKVFTGSRGGWDPHVASLKTHPEWNPTIRLAADRLALFRSEFPAFFD